jgi:hypothetical protein
MIYDALLLSAVLPLKLDHEKFNLITIIIIIVIVTVQERERERERLGGSEIGVVASV